MIRKGYFALKMRVWQLIIDDVDWGLRFSEFSIVYWYWDLDISIREFGLEMGIYNEYGDKGSGFELRICI